MNKVKYNTNNKIKVSVIVPIYNDEKHLKKSLNSIMSQSLKEIEIICVDDGSTDKSNKILNEYKLKDNRIKIIVKQHSGYSDTVNKGIDEAKGEYIGIVESDDVASEKMFETLYMLSDNGIADIVKGNYWDYFVYDDKPAKYYINNSHNQIADGEIFIEKNPEIIKCQAAIWSAIYKRAFIRRNDLHMMSGDMSDISFVLESLIKSKKTIWTKEPLYYKLCNNENSIDALRDDPSVFIKKMNDVLNIMEDNNVKSEAVNKQFCSSIISYLNMIVSNFNHDKHFDKLSNEARKLLIRLDEDIIKNELNLHDQLTYYTFSSPIISKKTESPKILIYNWLPFDNPWKWGGGVTVYCYNIISEMLKSRPDLDIYFISSGFAYNANTTKTFARKIGNVFGERVHQYEIVNSPVPAEQRNLYVNPLVALENKTLKGVFKDFIKDYGPFNAIHFNNVEGLSLDVLDLKEDFPETRFIFSIHNYVPLCVNGSYYMRHKHCNCNPAHTGMDCFKCTRMDIRSNLAIETYKRGLYGLNPEECISRSRWIKHFGFEKLDVDVSPDQILDFAKTATAKLNKNCDKILAVSKRVYEIAEENGFDKSKMSVDYIGTLVAAHQMRYATSEVTDGLKIVFLGSDINFEEKGYAFLLDALSEMDIKFASKIDLLLTVKSSEHAEIKKMCKNFRSLKIVQGYTHDDLKWIFKDAHLSIVPVLWEDNLPQIAIESVSYGVPVLASTAGGAKELCDSEMFRFECGNASDMNEKIVHFINFPQDLKEYWKHHHGLVTMPMHWSKLSEYYGLNNQKRAITFSLSDFNRLLKENEFLRNNLSLHEENFVAKSTLNELRNKLQSELAEKEQFVQRINELEKENEAMKSGAKLIFQTDNDPMLGETGANLFKIVLEDFVFSDFYAEIKFVNIANIAPSESDVLKISGTLLEKDDNKDDDDENDYNKKLLLHQLEWQNNNEILSQNISVYIRNNEIYFFGLHNGIASGYLYQLLTLTTRSNHDSAKFEKIHEGFLFENELKPDDSLITITKA